MAKKFRLSFPSATPQGRATEGTKRESGRAEAQRPMARLKRRLKAAGWQRTLLAVATVLTLSALLSLHLIPDRVTLRLGETSAQEIRAVKTVSYLDQSATDALRDAAADRAEPVYAAVPYAFPEADHMLGDVYALLRAERGKINAAHAADELRQKVGVAVSNPDVLIPILRDASSPYHLDQAERISRQIVCEAMGREIRDDRPDDLLLVRQIVAARVRASLLPRAYIPAVAALARPVLRPNRLLDRARTESARESERRLVSPQFAQVFAGDVIVRPGEIVTPVMRDKFRALGLQNPRLDWGMVTCVTLLIAFMASLVSLYLSLYHRAICASPKVLSLVCLIVVISVLGLKVSGAMLGLRLSEAQFGYVDVLCVSAAAMLIAALVNVRVALLVSILLATLCGLLLGSDLRFTLLALLSGFVGIFAVADIRGRSDVVRAAALLCATNVGLSLLMSRIEGDRWVDLGQNAVWAAVAGFSSVALFWLGVALLERPFGVTTHLGLLELSDPNRPLLRRFQTDAPGTFIHSVMVGNLAVAAAETIGADALLCRVGAYYHDLGKLKRAEYFVENQRGENIHEKLNPSLSALTVTAHVKDGLEIAEQEKLPPVVKAFITEHHGTSLVRYFFHQQTGGDEAGPGLEQHFRYAGPKPQSKETAILMLADGVEAASRTLEKPTLGRIEDLVAKIINGQLADGQLDECDLTLRDLRGIRDSFVRLLGGMLHSRVEYPEPKSEIKSEKNGTSDSSKDKIVNELLGGSERPAHADTAA